VIESVSVAGSDWASLTTDVLFLIYLGMRLDGLLAQVNAL
jgi:hypothetical protein